jgi:hypothetical protein
VVGQRVSRCSLPFVLAVVSLLTLISQIFVSPVPALSATPFHIEMTLQDPSSGGPITQNDALTLTVRIFSDGIRSRVGVVLVSMNSPGTQNLCRISTFPYSRDSCRIYLSNAGLTHIVARLTSTKTPPWRFVASESLLVNVQPNAGFG